MKFVPWNVCMLLAWVTVRQIWPTETLTSTLGVSTLLVSVALGVMMFMRSVDIQARAFSIRLVDCLSAGYLSGAFLVHLAVNHRVGALDLILVGILLAFSYASLNNSFRVALRNWAGTVSSESVSE